MMIGGGRWPITKLKRVTHRVAGGTPESDNEAYWCDPTDESATAWVAIGDMSQRQVVTSTTRAVTSAGLTSKRLTVGRPGTVLLAMYASVGEVATLGVPAAWNQAILGLNCLRGAYDSRYLGYLLRSMKPDLVGMTRSNTQDNLNAEQVGNLEVPRPPIGAQSAIADFLDRETAKIDVLIDRQRRFVETARARLVSLIYEVTTGKDLTGSFKDLGIRWLGQCPAHWTVGNIRRFALMRTGHTPSRTQPAYWENCHIPWFTLADVWQLRAGHMYLGETGGYISSLGLANSAAELLPAGTVVLSRTASVGFTGIMPRPMATSQDFWNWICGPQLRPEYLYFVFIAMRAEFEALRMGSTHQTIYQGDAASFQIPVPPLPEQAEIVGRLSCAKAQTEELIKTAQRMIELAQERRAALITAAVTGQLEISAAKGA